MTNATVNTKRINQHTYVTFNFLYFITALFKLLLLILFSFIIGFERELHTHPGGVCTHTLVGLGSCLFTMISVHLNDQYHANNADPARICAQIVSGMGFLGSATIFKSNNYVKGINTAANLWISAAISMAIGANLWEFAAVTSLLTLMVLLLNNRYKNFIYGRNNINSNTITELSHDPLDAPYGDENKIE